MKTRRKKKLWKNNRPKLLKPKRETDFTLNWQKKNIKSNDNKYSERQQKIKQSHRKNVLNGFMQVLAIIESRCISGAGESRGPNERPRQRID